MRKLAFSFQGRLKRLPFFLGGLGLGLAFLVGLIAILVGAAAAAGSREWGGMIGLILCILPLVVALFWCSLSLHVRRIRDIGWDPTIVIGAWLIANIADKLVLYPLLPAVAESHGTHGTYIGGALNLGLSLVLLLTPSREGCDDDDFVAAALSPMRIASGIPPLVVAPRLAQPLARAGAPREFGRRGLG